MPATAIIPRVVTIALVGNPNTGKSTLFSALAGVRQRVGNYPGVTVEKKIGHMQAGQLKFELVDLPGTYSLAPRSPDEMVTVDVLLNRQGDVRPVQGVLSILDASNLERNLYLLSQVLALGLPTVVALNMTDVARDRGMTIDVKRLRQQLGVPVVEVQANKRRGLDELKAALSTAVDSQPPAPHSPFPPEFQAEIAGLEKSFSQHASCAGAPRLPQYLIERLLLDSSGYLDTLLAGEDQSLIQELHAARERLMKAGCPIPAVEAMSRYGWVGRVLAGVVQRPPSRPVTVGDRLDRVLTHKVWGTLIFALLMLAMFTAVFRVADYPMRWIEAGIGAASGAVQAAMPEGTLRSLITDGVIAGVGGVIIFLPQILILFFFIGVLEDCGYMARAAYLMDKLMVRVGLSGKSFIPLLSSFACAVPGIMAARVIENRRDRLTTILVAPLMSCSARLPVYMVLIGAFIPSESYLGGLLQLQGLTLFGMYLLGIITAAIVALLLKRTLLRGATPPFVMELPSYKVPGAGVVLHRMLERGWGFIYRAGTLILAVSIVIWAATYYPHNTAEVEGPFEPRKAELQAKADAPGASDASKAAVEGELADIDHEIAAEYQRQSILGRLGRVVEPVVRPLGWDWRIGCAALASFPAREVVMGALGVIYNLGKDLDVGEEKDQNRLQARLQAATWDETGEPVYNIPVALSIMVFFALCAQCASTLAVIKRETNSWRWPAFTFVYMTALAYVGALITYQVGMRL